MPILQQYSLSQDIPVVFPTRCYASMGTSYGPVSVCVTSRCSIKTVELTELIFCMRASFDQSYTVL